MTIIKAGTQNVVKLQAIKSAFERYFDEVQVIGYEVDSHVPEQPVNEEVYRGAENRISQLKQIAGDYDFLVACESGLIFQYEFVFNMQVVFIEDKTGKLGVGLSQGYQIPSQYVRDVVKTNLADVLDGIFDGKGGIRMLTKNQFTREKLIQDGTTMALTRLLNGENW